MACQAIELKECMLRIVHRRSDNFVPPTQQSQARTRAFARVLGPWLAIAPGIIALRAPGMGALASEFFKSDLSVWFTGAALLFGEQGRRTLSQRVAAARHRQRHTRLARVPGLWIYVRRHPRWALRCPPR